MALNLSRNRGTYDGAAFFRDETKIAEKKIPLNSLVSWEGQPFEPYTDEAMESLAASIAENGLLSPIIVTADGDKYRIIAGHNRARACERLGWTEIDAIVKDTDEDHAQLMMLDTNLCQRHNLSVVELIKAYKMQFDVLNRIMGKKKGLKTLMAEQYGVTRKTIERYLKCANLEESLLTLLNDGRFNILTAVHLADLSAGNQSVLADWLNDNPKAVIDEKAAMQLISRNGFGFDEDDISEIISGKAAKSKSQPHEPHNDSEITEDEPPEKPAESNSDESKTQPAEVINNPPTSVETSPVTSEVDYDDLPDISVSFDRETIRRTLGKVGEDMVREYLNYCLQQDDVFSRWLEIFNQQS